MMQPVSQTVHQYSTAQNNNPLHSPRFSGTKKDAFIVTGSKQSILSFVKAIASSLVILVFGKKLLAKTAQRAGQQVAKSLPNMASSLFKVEGRNLNMQKFATRIVNKLEKQVLEDKLIKKVSNATTTVYQDTAGLVEYSIQKGDLKVPKIIKKTMNNQGEISRVVYYDPTFNFDVMASDTKTICKKVINNNESHMAQVIKSFRNGKILRYNEHHSGSYVSTSAQYLKPEQIKLAQRL